MPTLRFADTEDEVPRVVTNTEYGSRSPEDSIEITSFETNSEDNSTGTITPDLTSSGEWTEYAIQKLRYETRRLGAPGENNMRRDSVPEGEPQPTLYDPQIKAADPLPVAVRETAQLYDERGYKQAAESYPVKHIIDRLPSELRGPVDDGELEKAVIWYCVRAKRE